MLLRRYHEIKEKNTEKDNTNLETLTVKELKEIAKKENIEKYYDLNKQELINILNK